MPNRKSQPDPNRPERRGAPRYPYSLKAFCWLNVASTITSWMAQVRDLSANGVGLVAAVRFEPGTLLAVELRSPHWRFLLPHQVEIVRAASQDDASWYLGGAFTQALSQEEHLSALP